MFGWEEQLASEDEYSDLASDHYSFTDEEDDIPFAQELLQEVVVSLGDKISIFDGNYVELNFDTSILPKLMRQALGLADIEQFILKIMFDSRKFGAGTTPRTALRCVMCPQPPAEKANPSQEAASARAATAVDVEAMNAPGPSNDALHPQTATEQEVEEPAQAPSEMAESEDGSKSSESEQEFKQKVGLTVGYQLANIARQKIACDWPKTNHASWKEAKDWFSNLHKYLTNRMTNLGDYCVICDDPQPISGIKPVACSKHLCSHQFDEMGFGASMDLIYVFPTVADLLISMAASAATNTNIKHRQRFFACPNPPSDFVTDAQLWDKTKQPDNTMRINWTALQEVLFGLPSVADMAAARDLKSFLDQYHPHAYRLVRWILSTCRGHVVELDHSEQIQGMGGCQFKLFTNTFERELAFQKLKQQHGSRFLFHGSPFMNWHSIMRTCLQNFSNTDYMTAGAAYGPGVYTANNAGTSSMYCRARGHRWNAPQNTPSNTSLSQGYRASVFGPTASCLALVEVAESISNLPGHSIHVVKNHDAVVARYFFVYSSEKALPQHVIADTLKIPEWNS